MSSQLKQLQNYLEKYTEIISSVLNIDIEIVDDKLIRISGSGMYKDKINESVISEGYIYSNVIESGKELISLDMKQNVICINCGKYNNCKNKSIIAVPIKHEGKTLGAIGAVTVDKGMKEDLSKKIDSYLSFIENICDLISIKLEEIEINKFNDKKMQMFHSIINNFGKGIVIIDSSSNISYINDIAKLNFHITDDIIGKQLRISNYKKSTNDKEIITIDIEDNKYTLIANIIPVFPYMKSYDKVIIFKKIIDEEYDKDFINSGWGTNKLDSIIGKSSSMQRIKHQIKKLSKSSSTILITGESGTGKELIARAIHSEGRRRNKPFIAINCAAIPENLLESELFGYIKGAFSGASSSGKIGKFEMANEGVIFLDEIGDLSLQLQAKLLRVLQEKKFARLGSNKLIDLNIKVIAATNKNLLKLVNEGKYREDLYYRLNVIPLKLPPLRERMEDIEDLVNLFMDRYSEELGILSWSIDKKAMEMIEGYNWPGNIRELENAVEYMMNLLEEEEGAITPDMLPVDVLNYYKEKGLNKVEEELCIDIDSSNFKIDLKSEESILSIKDLESTYINKLLDRYGRSTKAKKMISKKLGIGLATLYRKIEE